MSGFGTDPKNPLGPRPTKAPPMKTTTKGK